MFCWSFRQFTISVVDEWENYLPLPDLKMLIFKNLNIHYSNVVQTVLRTIRLINRLIRYCNGQDFDRIIQQIYKIQVYAECKWDIARSSHSRHTRNTTRKSHRGDWDGNDDINIHKLIQACFLHPLCKKTRCDWGKCGPRSFDARSFCRY